MINKWQFCAAKLAKSANYCSSAFFAKYIKIMLVMTNYAKDYVTTSCKNFETLRRKNDLSCFKSLPATGLWDIILTSLLHSIQSCSSKFCAWSCIASNFDKGWRGNHQHEIMDGPFKSKYGTVSQVLLQLVVSTIYQAIAGHIYLWHNILFLEGRATLEMADRRFPLYY